MKTKGYTIREIPQRTEVICNGCEYLCKEAGMRGHFKVTNNFACAHPVFQRERMLMSNKAGRTIHFNHEGDCQTPSWCPFLSKNKKDETTPETTA